ncbi:MAG: right-handed parallel beta-helix repeat-containing protein [Sedimentisphaerales bacterium]|nr:right-handed parallel beta-helix repeat-containing protein [Sedimentisphaerales bacterium]
MRKHIFAFLVPIFVCSGVWAVEEVKDSFTTTSDNSTYVYSTTTKKGQAFTSSGNYLLTKVDFWMANSNNTMPTSAINVAIWAADSNDLPTGGAAITSGTLSTTNLSTTYAWKTFDVNDVNVTSGTKYAILINAPDCNSAKYLKVGIVDAGGYANGKGLTYTTGSWATTATADRLFRVYGETISDGNQTNTTPPTPNPMTFATAPHAVSDTEIDMIATTATDSNGVEYQFEQTVGGTVTTSVWQDSATYNKTSLTLGTQYTFRVSARDKSANQNATAWSSSALATTTGGSGTAGTYYLDATDGNDTNTGLTPSTAWKTLSKCLATITSGNTVRCKTGSYGTFSKTGTSGYTSETTFIRDTYSDVPVFGAVNLNYTSDAVKNLTFNGITMQYAYITHAQYVKLINCTIRNTVSWQYLITSAGLWSVGGVVCEYSDYITIENCDIYKHAQGILSDYATNVICKGNKIHGVANDMIQYGGGVLNSVYERNNIYDMDSLVFPFKTPWSTLAWDTVGSGVTQTDALYTHQSTTIPDGFTGVAGSKNYTAFDASYFARWDLTLRSTIALNEGDMAIRFSDDPNGGTSGHYYDANIPAITANTTTNLALGRFSSAAAIAANPAAAATDANFPLVNLTDLRSISLVAKRAKTGSRIFYFRTLNSAGTGEVSNYFRHPSTTINTIDADNFRCNMNQATSNVIIRKNIIHGLWSTGTGTAFSLGGSNWANAYPLNDSTIENNLVFGNKANHLFRISMGQNVVIQNNTIVGFVSSLLPTSYYSAAHFTSDTFKPIIPTDNTGTYTGSGCKIRNNILSTAYVSSGGTGYVTPTVNSFANLDWSGNVVQDLTSTIIAAHPDNYEISAQSSVSLDANCFTSPSFHIDSANIGEISTVAGGFNLKAGSPAINYGDVNNQPTDSLGTVDSDGFILDNGPVRDATHHSAGCYEYGSDTPTLDDTPPTPNPMTFAEAPAAMSSTAIFCMGTAAVDAGGSTPVQYLFTNKTTATNSGWVDYPAWASSGLTGGTVYVFTVQARDSRGNTGTVSADVNGITSPYNDTAAPTPNPMTFAAAPAAVSNSSITMTATTASDYSGAEYYFTCNDANFSSGWQDSTAYTATGLTAGTAYSFTVKARDKSYAKTAGTASSSASATTMAGWDLTIGTITNFSDNSYMVNVTNGGVYVFGATSYGEQQPNTTQITLYAFPNKGHSFVGWTADDVTGLDLAANPLTISMTKNRIVTPTYRRNIGRR